MASMQNKKGLSESFISIQVDNVITFPSMDNERIREFRGILNLKQCGKTKSCLSSGGINPYKCDGFAKCNKVSDFLKHYL